MVHLDTNILVYAADINSPLFATAKKIRDEARNGKLDACISLQNLAEFYSVVTNPSQVGQPIASTAAKEEVEKYLVCSTIRKLEISLSTLNSAIQLAEKYKVTKQYFYDTRLVATMLEHNVTKILTLNIRDFVTFREIQSENPFKPPTSPLHFPSEPDSSAYIS